jgi:hypothetical protein
MSDDRTVEFFEMPACGDPRSETAFNPELQEISKMVKELELDGVKVFRYLPSEDMAPFFKNYDVATLMHNQRLSVLPITVVNGDVIKVESYPSREEVRSALSKNGQ